MREIDTKENPALDVQVIIIPEVLKMMNISSVQHINCGKKHQANSSNCEVHQRISNRSKFNLNSLKRSTNGDDEKQLFIDYEDNIHQSIKSTKTRVSKSYSQAVRKNFVNNKSPIRNQYNESNESFSSM